MICREDLPRNPHWRREGYPAPFCWDIDEFFEEAAKAGPGSRLYSEARRIYWEAYWRRLGRYKRGRPFFAVYVKEKERLKRLRDRERWVENLIIASATAHGIVPREALLWVPRIYKVLFEKERGATS